MLVPRGTKMRTSKCQVLSDGQVERLEIRRQNLGLTRAELLDRFETALKSSGCVHTEEAAKMRLERVFNPRIRRPVSECTKLALATALHWNFAQFQRAIDISADVVRENNKIDNRISEGEIAKIACALAALA